MSWLQNEGMVPSLDNLTELVKDFKNVIVSLTMIETGIKASKDITDIINSISRVRLNLTFLKDCLVKRFLTFRFILKER
jgi:hypothetical protein